MESYKELTYNDLLDIIHEYDAELTEHCDRTADLCNKLAAISNFSEKSNLVLAARIHDIGKVLIPLHILHKQGKLNRFEIVMMRSHAHWGYELLQPVDIPEIAKQFVLYHHGLSNFPTTGVIGEIHTALTRYVDNTVIEGSLILQCCDIFDAVTSDRPYHAARSKETAYEILHANHLPDRLIEGIKSIT